VSVTNLLEQVEPALPRVSHAGRTAAGGDVAMPRLSRADRATSRAEFGHRWSKLRAIAPTGRQALAAQGALAVIWHHDQTTAAGFLPMGPGEVAQLLDVDERTWRSLARLLEETGLLLRGPHGYQVPASTVLEGTSDTKGAPGGFLRTWRPAYARHAASVRAAATGQGRRGLYVLAALGAYEVLRVTRANWRTGITRWAGSTAARLVELSRHAWAGYLRLLEAAGLIARTGALVRMLGWHVLSWGPSWRVNTRPRQVSQVHNATTSTPHEVHNSTTLSTAKARTEVTNVPPTPTRPAASEPSGSSATKRGDHPQLNELLKALTGRLPAGREVQWRHRLRQNLSAALTSAGGDVAAVAGELTARELSTARNLPAALAWRAGQAVEKFTQKTASQEARGRANEARAVAEAQDAAKAAQIAAQRVLAEEAASAAPSDYRRLLEIVAQDLGRPSPTSPGFTPGTAAMVEAVARTRVRKYLPPSSDTDTGSMSGHSPESVREAVRSALAQTDRPV